MTAIRAPRTAAPVAARRPASTPPNRAVTHLYPSSAEASRAKLVARTCR
jgi:hypothetical protein